VIATRYKMVFGRMLEPLARGMVRAGIPPSVLTVSGAVLSGLVCLWFIRTRAVLPFCVAIVVTGGLDALDGAVARSGGRVTKFGAYLDAVCDRYVEAAGAIAAAVVTGYWVLSAAVLAGALLVSYAKARAAMEVNVSNQEWPDLMERTERDLLFVAGLAASAIWPVTILGRDLFWWTLAILAVLIHLTVLQRVWRARRLIWERSR